MNTQTNLLNILKHPSAFLPIAMSLLAVGIVLTHLAFFGAAPQKDEGTAAHLWQLLMAGQLPFIFFFAIRWLPQTPRCALPILALQAAAAAAALAPVFLLHW
jgi:FtsH-binding integral membrane protein